MANLRRGREGLSAAEQSSSVSVPRDHRVGTQSFGSQNGAYDDLCAPNEPNGRDARRGSGRLEDQQQASPTSVAARRAYDGSGRRPGVVDDAQHPRDVDVVKQWLCSGSQPDAPPRAAAWRLSACSGPGLGTSDALRNASVVAACLRHGASPWGAAADEEPLEPSRKKPRPLAVETPPRALLAPAAGRGGVLRDVTINGRRYLLSADAIEPVVERVEAGDAGEALHFCDSRGVHVALDALYGRGAVDTVNRAWKSGLASYADAYAEASSLMLRSLEAAVANSRFRGSRAVVVPQLRSKDTVLNEESFAWKTAEAVARGAGGRVVALLSRSVEKGKSPAGDVDVREDFHDDGKLQVDLRELERLVVEEGVTAFLVSDDDAGTGASNRVSRNVVVEALEKLGLTAEVHGVVAVRYCHDTTGRALTAKVRDAFAKVALRVRLADGSETGEGAHAGLIYTYGGQLRRCALPRRYDGSHGVPPEIWERERSNLEAAVAKGEEGRAEVREVLARLASTRLGQHQRAGARGEHNDPVNTFFDDYAAENGGETFCIPDNAEVLAVLYSKQDESRTQFFEELREYEDLYLDQMERMVEGAVPCRSRLVSARLKPRDLTRACACAGGRIVKLTVATKASGAAALTELVPDPRRPGAVWKSSTNELCYAENYCGNLREPLRRRAAAVKGTTSRRWRGTSTPSSRCRYGTTSRRWRGASEV